MKKNFLFMLCLLLFANAYSQIKDPVAWEYNAKNRGAGIYEITITANVPKPWHMYSQHTPKGGPVPTKISFNANPLLTLQGGVKEAGKLEKINDKVFEILVMYYSGKVVFTQLVKVKNGVKTNIAGTVNYMVCDDEQCLPPTKKTFELKLQ